MGNQQSDRLFLKLDSTRNYPFNQLFSQDSSRVVVHDIAFKSPHLESKDFFKKYYRFQGLIHPLLINFRANLEQRHLCNDIKQVHAYYQYIEQMCRAQNCDLDLAADDLFKLLKYLTENSIATNLKRENIGLKAGRIKYFLRFDQVRLIDSPIENSALEKAVREFMDIEFRIKPRTFINPKTQRKSIFNNQTVTRPSVQLNPLQIHKKPLVNRFAPIQYQNNTMPPFRILQAQQIARPPPFFTHPPFKMNSFNQTTTSNRYDQQPIFSQGSADWRPFQRPISPPPIAIDPFQTHKQIKTQRVMSPALRQPVQRESVVRPVPSLSFLPPSIAPIAIRPLQFDQSLKQHIHENKPSTPLPLSSKYFNHFTLPGQISTVNQPNVNKPMENRLERNYGFNPTPLKLINMSVQRPRNASPQPIRAVSPLFTLSQSQHHINIQQARLKTCNSKIQHPLPIARARSAEPVPRNQPFQLRRLQPLKFNQNNSSFINSSHLKPLTSIRSIGNHNFSPSKILPQSLKRIATNNHQNSFIKKQVVQYNPIQQQTAMSRQPQDLLISVKSFEQRVGQESKSEQPKRQPQIEEQKSYSGNLSGSSSNKLLSIQERMAIAIKQSQQVINSLKMN